jgi:hypothetical protein
MAVFKNTNGVSQKERLKRVTPCNSYQKFTYRTSGRTCLNIIKQQPNSETPKAERKKEKQTEPKRNA